MSLVPVLWRKRHRTKGNPGADWDTRRGLRPRLAGWVFPRAQSHPTRKAGQRLGARAVRARSYIRLVITILSTLGLVIGDGMAVAAIPCAESTSASRAAAGEKSAAEKWSPNFARSTPNSIAMPVGQISVAVGVPGNISTSHPARCRGGLRCRASISLSGVEGDATMVTCCFSKPARPREMAAPSSSDDLGASRDSSLTRASFSSSAFWMASAARAFAPAIAARACSADTSSAAALSCAFAVPSFARAVSSANEAIFSPADSLAKSQWCSLTIPIQTMVMVAAAPTIRLPTNSQLARSNIQLAQSSEGQGSFPAWFAISAIAIIMLIGAVGLALIGSAIRKRRY